MQQHYDMLMDKLKENFKDVQDVVRESKETQFKELNEFIVDYF